MSTGALTGRQGAAYGALGLPLAFLALPMTITLPHHVAQQHGVPLAQLGALLLGTRLLDTLLDPWIGQWMDRWLRAPLGRLMAMAAVAAAVIGAGFFALFHAPFLHGQHPPALWGWLGLNLVVVYLGYSALSMLHQAWGMRLGGDESQRSRVAGWREGFGLAGVLVASVLPSLLGMTIASAVLIAALGAGLWLLSRVPFSRDRGTDHGPASVWWMPMRHSRFRALLALYMLNGIGNAVAATLLTFFVQDRLALPDALPLFLGAYFLAAVLSLPVWMRAIARLGLTRAWALGMALSVAGFGGALLLGEGDRAGFVAVCLLSGAALGADLAAPAALLTGLLHRMGRADQAGLHAGWWTAATKLNLGIAAGLALPLLAWAGYVPGQRDAASLQALSLAYVAVPCLLKLIAIAGLLTWRRADRAWSVAVQGDAP